MTMINYTGDSCDQYLIIWMECFLLSWYPSGRSRPSTFRGTEGYAKGNPIELGLPNKPRGSCGKIWGFRSSSVDVSGFLWEGGKWFQDTYICIYTKPGSYIVCR